MLSKQFAVIVLRRDGLAIIGKTAFEHDLCLAIVLAFLSIEAQGDYLLSF